MCVKLHSRGVAGRAPCAPALSTPGWLLQNITTASLTANNGRTGRMPTVQGWMSKELGRTEGSPRALSWELTYVLRTTPDASACCSGLVLTA